jgi:hypothetical protein
MIAQFTLSEETIDKIVVDYVRVKHGFGEQEFDVKVERSEDDRREKIARVWVSEKP